MNPLAADRAAFLAPHWLLHDMDGAIRAHNLADGSQHSISGQLADDLRRVVTDGDPTLQQGIARSLAALAALAPPMAALAKAVATSAPRAVTPSLVLRGRHPVMAFVELTSQCNERCAHCYADASPEGAAHLMGQALTDTLNSIASAGFTSVQFTGGDPLISPALLGAVRHAKELGLSVEIYTNGLALSEALLDSLMPAAPRFALSIYSHDPARHDRITRVPGSHRRTRNAIKRLLTRSVPVRIGIAATDPTPSEVQQTIAWLVDLGVQREKIRVDAVRQVGRGRAFADQHQPAAVSPEPGRALPAAVGTTDEAGDVQTFWGRLCALPDGRFCGCILDRTPVAETLDELMRMLDDERPLEASWDRIRDTMQEYADKLSCWPCRFRRAALDVAT